MSYKKQIVLGLAALTITAAPVAVSFDRGFSIETASAQTGPRGGATRERTGTRPQGTVRRNGGPRPGVTPPAVPRVATPIVDPGKIARERAEAERIALALETAERIARERAEAERIARSRSRAEAERIARDRAEAERIARSRAEQERVSRLRTERVHDDWRRGDRRGSWLWPKWDKKRGDDRDRDYDRKKDRKSWYRRDFDRRPSKHWGDNPAEKYDNYR